jgi:threonine/homoserine/homoserine lactone efflux protein
LIQRSAEAGHSGFSCRRMPDLLFITGLALLLVTPGPTNTLLMTAGASGRASGVRLLAAELTGYLAAIAGAGLLIRAGFTALPGVEVALKGAAACWLVWCAVKLWRSGGPRAEAAALITPGMVGLTTLMNPKGLIIAFGLMPAGWTASLPLAAPSLLTLALMVPLMGGAWFLGGGWLAKGERQALLRRWLPRGSALALGLFAALLARAAFAG